MKRAMSCVPSRRKSSGMQKYDANENARNVKGVAGAAAAVMKAKAAAAAMEAAAVAVMEAKAAVDMAVEVHTAGATAQPP
jgi:hypothetical protein